MNCEGGVYVVFPLVEKHTLSKERDGISFLLIFLSKAAAAEEIYNNRREEVPFYDFKSVM